MARVLVVDDQRIPRVAVTTILTAAEHAVQAAESGEEGMDLAASWSPDVIILDVNMPGMDGFEVVERLKSDPATASIPIIMLTAEAPTDDLIVRGLELGAYDFLSKGCSRAELLARVGVMARIKRGVDELSAIARVSDSLIQAIDPAEIASRFVEQVGKIFRADGVLMAFTPTGESDRRRSAANLDVDDPLVPPLEKRLLEILPADAGPTLELDAADLRGAAGVLARKHGYESAIIARVDHHDREPLLLAVFSTRPDGFIRDSDAPLLHLLAGQANVALDNAFLHQHAREQALALEELMTHRSRFFASMSHELRTPINAVIGYNQLLELGTFGQLNQAQADAVDRVNRSAQQLLALINDVLDISKIEAGKFEMEIEDANLTEIIQDAVTSVQLQAEAKGLEISIDLPAGTMCRTDPARLRQVLLNLLSNAVKFTEEGSVRVTARERRGAYEIRVIDTGPGVPEEDRDRIFEEFEQSGTRGSGGTGLGLAISRRLVNLLGGELKIESTVGEGSAFVMLLPQPAAGE
jgi:signal transduction histidine kinase/ActR/RegA family two-component response regulator